jgi:hypothetical protein
MSGQGTTWVVPWYAPWPALFDAGSWTGDLTGVAIAADWYFAGRGPLVPVDIDWTWLSPPVQLRSDPPVNQASVSRTDGSTAPARDQDSIDTYGYWAHSATVDSDSPADPRNLATWLVTYYPDPRPRLTFTMKLRSRTDSECRLILGRECGDRIRVTNTPTGWPVGGTQLVIEGVQHESASDERTVTWLTAPLAGTTADLAGPWFRLDVSQLDGTDVMPF